MTTLIAGDLFGDWHVLDDYTGGALCGDDTRPYHKEASMVPARDQCNECWRLWAIDNPLPCPARHE